MSVADFLREKAKRKKAFILLPEPDDERVVRAYQKIKDENIADVRMIGKADIENQKIDEFGEIFYELRKHKDISKEDAIKTVKDPLYYSALMVRQGYAQGFVAGAKYTTSSVARAAIYCLELSSRDIACSSFIMEIPDCKYGEKGVFVFADCAINPDPSSESLAKIAICTAEMAKKVIGFEPRVAMLSYSTRGSAIGRRVEKVREATDILRREAPNLIVDGEMQVDSAVVPEVAEIKYPDSKLGGRANILIFPNLEAGNIGYKLTQRLANARAIGPLLQGLRAPCSDLSRGCYVDDVIDCVAVTAIRASS